MPASLDPTTVSSNFDSRSLHSNSPWDHLSRSSSTSPKPSSPLQLSGISPRGVETFPMDQGGKLSPSERYQSPLTSFAQLTLLSPIISEGPSSSHQLPTSRNPLRVSTVREDTLSPSLSSSPTDLSQSDDNNNPSIPLRAWLIIHQIVTTLARDLHHPIIHNTPIHQHHHRHHLSQSKYLYLLHYPEILHLHHTRLPHLPRRHPDSSWR
jgi:hypothetical protein